MLVHGPTDALGDHPSRLGGNPLEDDDELVAPEPGELVPRPTERPEEARELDEDDVPRPVPQGVVDDLEVVEVEEEERAGRASARPGHDPLEALFRRAPVPEVRERVVEGEVADPLLGTAALRDVLLDGDEVTG